MVPAMRRRRFVRSAILCSAFVLVGCTDGPGQTQTKVPTAAASSTSPLTPFAGDWRGHGRMLLVRADGTATLMWRVYRWCGNGAAVPCDSKKGGRIVFGGSASFTLSSVTGRVARGTVTSTTDASTLPKGKIVLSMGADDVLRVDPLGLLFCASSARAFTCGA
jgi:hypothetical protein